MNHLDCNPSNNRADNLEWTTYKGNMQYASSLGRMQYNVKNLKKAQESKKIPVVAIKDGDRKVYPSSSDAARELGALALAATLPLPVERNTGTKLLVGMSGNMRIPRYKGNRRLKGNPSQWKRE